MEKELRDAHLRSVSGDKMILHSNNNQILIYDCRGHGIKRHGCPSGRHFRMPQSTNRKVYECLCNVTSDAVYHSCATQVEKEGGLYDTEVQIYKLAKSSMKKVKTLKYFNSSLLFVCSSTFYIRVNKTWITFSFDLMKEIVLKNRKSFALFVHSDRFYAVDNGILYSLDLSNAVEQIELSNGETIEGDIMSGWFLTTHSIGGDVYIVQSSGIWKLSIANCIIKKLPIPLPPLTSCTFYDSVLYFKGVGSEEIQKLDLTPFLSTNRESATQEELIPKMGNTKTAVKQVNKVMCALLAADRKELTCPVCLEIFQNPKVVPKCGHSLCSTCEVRISVEDPIQKKKTLSCPVCLAAVELNIDEYLPVNWIVKDLPTTYNHHRGGSPKKPKHSLKCSSCNAPLSQKNTFDCEFCAELDQNIEVLICATCVFDYHKEHINSVQRVRFADAAYKMGKIGGISRDAEELGRKKASTLMELDVFFGQLEQYCERVKSRLEKLGGKGPMTQKVVDKEVEELMKDYGVIKRKLEKLCIWRQ